MHPLKYEPLVAASGQALLAMALISSLIGRGASPTLNQQKILRDAGEALAAALERAREPGEL